MRLPGTSSQAISGTRKIAPTDARSAFGESGSAQPSERATPAPNASAVLDQGADVPRVGEAPEGEAGVADGGREVGAAVDADRASGMRQRRDAGEQGLLDRLTGDEEVHGLDPRGPGRLDEVLPLGGEQPALVAVLPLSEELADELQRVVVARGDHGRSHSSQLPWKSRCAASRGGPGHTRSSSS